MSSLPATTTAVTVLSVEEACRRLRQDDDETLTALKVWFSSPEKDDAAEAAAPNAPVRPPNAKRRGSATHSRRRHAEATQLASALEGNAVLSLLDVRDAGLQDDDVSVIGRALEVHPSLQQWILSQNAIGVDGASAIADFLVRNSTLTWLALQENDLGPDGAAELADALTTNRTLQKLQLQDNRIRSDGTSRLAQVLAVNRALTLLDLSSNQVKDEGLAFLSEVLLGRGGGGGGLQELILTHNEITDEGAQELADALLRAETISLMRVDLTSNPITATGAMAIRMALHQTKTSNVPVVLLDVEDDNEKQEAEEKDMTPVVSVEEDVDGMPMSTMYGPDSPTLEPHVSEEKHHRMDDETNRPHEISSDPVKDEPSEETTQSRLESNALSFESDQQTITNDTQKPSSLSSLDSSYKQHKETAANTHVEELVDATATVRALDIPKDDREHNVTEIPTIETRNTESLAVENDKPDDGAANEEEQEVNGVVSPDEDNHVTPSLASLPNEAPVSFKTAPCVDETKEAEVIRVASVKSDLAEYGEVVKSQEKKNDVACPKEGDHNLAHPDALLSPHCDTTSSTPATVTVAKPKHNNDDHDNGCSSPRHSPMTMDMASSLLVELDTAEEMDRPLHAAIKHSHVVTLVEELRVRNVNETDSRGRTPADYAAICGQVQMLSLLEHRGGEFRIGSKAKMRSLAEARALEKASAQSLENSRSSLSLGDVGGSSGPPSTTTATAGTFASPEAQILLMAASVGFDASLQEDEEDAFPLHAAIRYEDLELLQEEVEGAADRMALFRRVDALGRSAADFCAIRGEGTMLQWLESMGGGVFFVGSRARMRRVCRDVAMARRRTTTTTP